MSSVSSPTSAAAPLNRPMITISIMLATLIQTLDSTIANVALPHMQGTLSASQDEITWVLTSYIVAAAIATPLTGWLSDRLSVKRLLIVAIGGFTVSSALCGLSETLTQIVASRLLQGIFGASLVPLSQSILLDINPREKQGQAMAVWGMGVMVGPILGPTLGGWLTDSYNWRWVFFINVPIGAFALFGVATFLPTREPNHDVKFDAFGFITLGLAIGALQVVWPGVIQGFGLGLVFVPLSALTFSTLAPELRADGTATYSLMRNIGSSIGISIVQTLMTRNTQVSHADLAANITPFNPAIQPMLNSGSNYDIAALNASITQQASMIAYLNDFKLMFVATLLVIPLLLLIRPSSKAPDASVAHAAMD
ncbi:Putative multidrug resistance protein MdtD [Paraburkholderia ultramafica]|uniref:Multidrug resistance protein MdtD n=1 Tax=Paraburkholderia ultramafica TaxID=1544867 RepID=A0A6S7B2X0_9BURK|nr:MDR family MFS transporter [Paraburkholderia ultramafica]CAB3783810.1 Putative multidrug resistance protein MdtD [Paraburkholderia ultramafica]